MKKHVLKVFFSVFFLFGFILVNDVHAAYNPVLTNISLNGGNNITLSAGTNTSVNATATVYDQDGYTDIDTITAKIYRSGVSGEQLCSTDINNCYSSTCTLSNCSSNTCDVTCPISMPFNADSTVLGSPYVDQYWRAYLSVEDFTGGASSGFSIINSPDVNSLLAIQITPSIINYGTVNPNQNTGSTNQTLVIQNIGNRGSAIELSGSNSCRTTDPTCSGGAQATLLPSRHKYLASTFTYITGGIALSTSATGYAGINLTKPTQSPTNSSGTLYWGLGVPIGQLAGVYSGQITISATQFLACNYAQCTSSANCGGAACTYFYRDADADNLGLSTCSIRACGTTPPVGYATSNTDTNDSQYCPNASYNPPGACQKCVNGAIANQTSAEDLFGECNSGDDGENASCQAVNCSGTGASCGVLSSGTTCRSAKSVCDVAETCNGSSSTCPIDAFQPMTFDISSTTTCQECSGTGSELITQSNTEDRWGQCINGGTSGGIDSCKSNNCDGTLNACATLPSSTVCRTAANTCDAPDYCSGTTGSFDCTTDNKLSGKQTCSTCTTCDGINNSCQIVSGGTDPNNDCSSYSCSSYIWGWGASLTNSCRVASANATQDGMCNGAAACYSGITNQCIEGSQSGSAVCGSSGCKRPSPACNQNTTPTSTYNSVASVCYTDGAQHSCSAGTGCDSTGTCVAQCVATNGDCSGGLTCCSGSCNTFYSDSDSDTYGNPSSSIQRCATTVSGYVTNNTDCCDADINTNPVSTTCSSSPNGCGNYNYNCSGGDTKCDTICWSTNHYMGHFNMYDCTGITCNAWSIRPYMNESGPSDKTENVTCGNSGFSGTANYLSAYSCTGSCSRSFAYEGAGDCTQKCQ